MGLKNKIKPSYVDFNHAKYKWKPNIDYRKNPHLYEIGRGQQGVLTCEPYKSELHPLWRFKTPEEAQLSANKIYLKYLEYLDNGDFVGCDMAKKYLHMGFTRARRYWNHSSGKKWINDGEWKVLPYDRNEQRFMDSSLIFQRYWKMVREDKRYLDMKKNFKKNKRNEKRYN